MKRLYTLLLLPMLCSAVVFGQPARMTLQQFFGNQESNRSAANFLYDFGYSTEAFMPIENPISINQGEIWDEEEYFIGLPFPLEVNGQNILALVLHSNGFLFGLTEDMDIVVLIAGFATDLIDRGYDINQSQSPINGAVEGLPGNQILKLEWLNAGSYFEMADLGTLEMFVNFQIWIYEASGSVEYRYGPSSVDNPAVFYDGDPGPAVGIITVDFSIFEAFDLHLLTGPAESPILTDMEALLTGTPPEDIVYLLSISGGFVVDILHEDGTCGLPNGSAMAVVTGGTPPFEYLWSNGEMTETITDLEEGIYSVTVSDGSGMEATAEVEIFNSGPVFANASATDETTPGANDGTATAEPTGGTEPYAYEWSNGSTDQTITDLEPGDYTVTVTDADGCTDEETVTVNPFVDCDEILVEVFVTHASCFGSCDGSVDDVVITGGTPPYFIEFDFDFEDLCAGSYSLTVVDINGCTGTADFEISEPEELLANASATDETGEGANDGTATSEPSGGTAPYTYEWSTGSTDQTIEDLEPGDYTVTVTDANGCTAEETVTVGPADPCADISMITITTPATCAGNCDGSISVFDVFGGTPPYTYAWSTGDSTSTLEDLCAGSYGLTVTDSEGCQQTAEFTVNEPDPVVANAGSTHETESGAEDGTAWSAPSGGTPPYTYAWSNGGADSLITDLAPGAYMVTVTDANGCTDWQTVTVLSYECSLLEIHGEVTDLLCHEVCDGSIEVQVENATEPVTYVWNTGDETNIITGLCAGTYSVTATDAGGCQITATYTVTQPDELLANAGSTDESFPLANDGSAWAAPTGGTPPYAYAWSTGDTDSLLVDLAPGDYTVTVTDDNGCTAEATVTVEALECTEFLFAITITDVSCHGDCDGGIDLHPNGDYDYQWSTGSTETGIENLCAGDYSVTISDPSTGCMEFWIFEITEPEELLIAVDEVAHLTDTTATAIRVSVSGGTPPYTFAWTGPDAFESDEEMLSDIEVGEYVLVVTDANGCEAATDAIEVRDERVSTYDPVALGITVYPNPAGYELHIDAPDIADYEVRLYSVDGKAAGHWRNTTKIDVSSIEAGMYILKVTSGDRFATYRVVVSR